MSENPIAISKLNDFIFCPASICFHGLEENEENLLYQDSFQINGTNAHKNSDTATYSTCKSVLQGVSVYCEKYNIYGKIDVFDKEKGILTERKKKIRTIYDGYVFQLYAQYFALSEMGYSIETIRLYSMDDNKIYNLKKPCENQNMLDRFEKLINDMSVFVLQGFHQDNIEKCSNCIYEIMCSFSALKE